VTGDGRGNENIALTMIHQIFHAEHNRLVAYIDQQINALLTPAEIAAWHAVDGPSGWDYGERLFQAARFGTEMQYQHLVFEEFARKMQPSINPFLGGITSINPAISAEFAHTVYRLGHSMLPERVSRINADGSNNDIRLLNAFLNPVEYNDGGPAGPLTADKAAGAIIRGLVLQVGNELDEFVTSSVRNTLLAQPLDLAAINLARGRSEGIPPLNEVRRQLFAQTKDASLTPYPNWFEFGLHLRHIESLVNFVAAYGTHQTITAATTVATKRAARESAHRRQRSVYVLAGRDQRSRPPWTSGSAVSQRNRTSSAVCSDRRSTTSSSTSWKTCRTATVSTTSSAPMASISGSSSKATRLPSCAGAIRISGPRWQDLRNGRFQLRPGQLHGHRDRPARG
jgi:hypothetical protein